MGSFQGGVPQLGANLALLIMMMVMMMIMCPFPFNILSGKKLKTEKKQNNKYLLTVSNLFTL